MKSNFAKLIYKADIDGDITIEQQIIEATNDSIHGASRAHEWRFEFALRYDITRTVINILSNSSIKYGGFSNPFCESLQKNLTDIFFHLHDHGSCFLKIDAEMRISNINQISGNVKLVDPAYEITGFTQKIAARKALDMYGVVTDASYSVIDERGVLGMFSPQKDTVVKPSQLSKLYDSFRFIFGAKRGQRKFMITEVPMTYSGVTIPVKDLDLLANKKDAVATVARIYGIGEDMIQGGAIFANKQNAIIQTYSDYKGLIYMWITQIESQLISFRSVENYEVTFSGVPQLQIQQTNNIPQPITIQQPQ